MNGEKSPRAIAGNAAMPAGKRLMGGQMLINKSCRPGDGPWAKHLLGVREALGSNPSMLQRCSLVIFQHMERGNSRLTSSGSSLYKFRVILDYPVSTDLLMLKCELL